MYITVYHAILMIVNILNEPLMMTEFCNYQGTLNLSSIPSQLYSIVLIHTYNFGHRFQGYAICKALYLLL